MFEKHFFKIQQYSLGSLRKIENLGFLTFSVKLAETPEDIHQNWLSFFGQQLQQKEAKLKNKTTQLRKWFTKFYLVDVLNSERCKRFAFVNLVDLVKRFQTSMYLQTLASIQPRTVPSVFEDDPVHQPASQPRTGLSKFAKNILVTSNFSTPKEIF